MTNISVLPEALANQIAAGEVVERPASVVKELVENALDAQSTKVKVSLQEGGLSLIQVRDNGTGIAQQDVEKAFYRHATSKIKSTRDLFNIRSLGFRGEALPSIAAVAEVSCKTRRRGEDIGTHIVVKGGKVESIEPIAQATGVDIEVRHLFYNTPARLKHLKTINTEISHVSDIINRLALAYPHVSFELEHEGKTLLRTLGDGNLHHVIQAVYGQRVAQSMLHVEAETIDFHLNGYISKPDTTRASRTYTSLIVNGRFIRSYRISEAVLRAYHTLLTVNRWPIAVLHLTMDPKLIDVNVHPSKLEVRFSKERELSEWITSVLRQRLLDTSLVPKVTFPIDRQQKKTEQIQLPLERPNLEQPKLEQPKIEQSLQIKEQATMYSKQPSTVSSSSRQVSTIPWHQDSTIRRSMERAFEHKQTVHEKPTSHKENRRLPSLTPLAQVHGTYIVAQSETSLFLVDQHAAHERVYYEIFRRQLEGESSERQELLFPISLELTIEEDAKVSEKFDLLTQLGLQLEPFGERTYLVRTHPVWFPSGKEEALIREIVDWVMDRDNITVAELRDEHAKQLACKAAIKANRHLSKDDMQALLDQLCNTQNPFTCPHGRPTLLELTAYELEKLFKRVM